MQLSFPIVFPRKSHRNAGLVILFLGSLVIAGVGKPTASHADEVLLSLKQQEYSSPSRSGKFDIILPDSGPPFLSDPTLGSLVTGLWVEASWEKICTNNIFVSGGTANGWLLGPLSGPEVNAFYNAFFSRSASTAYAILVGDFLGTGFGGEGTRIACSGTTTPVAFGFMYLFILDSPIGNHVADLFYLTEISTTGEWYKITR